MNSVLKRLYLVIAMVVIAIFSCFFLYYIYNLVKIVGLTGEATTYQIKDMRLQENSRDQVMGEEEFWSNIDNPNIVIPESTKISVYYMYGAYSAPYGEILKNPNLYSFLNQETFVKIKKRESYSQLRQFVFWFVLMAVGVLLLLIFVHVIKYVAFGNYKVDLKDKSNFLYGLSMVLALVIYFLDERMNNQYLYDIEQYNLVDKLESRKINLLKKYALEQDGSVIKSIYEVSKYKKQIDFSVKQWDSFKYSLKMNGVIESDGLIDTVRIDIDGKKFDFKLGNQLNIEIKDFTNKGTAYYEYEAFLDRNEKFIQYVKDYYVEKYEISFLKKNGDWVYKVSGVAVEKSGINNLINFYNYF